MWVQKDFSGAWAEYIPKDLIKNCPFPSVLKSWRKEKTNEEKCAVPVSFCLSGSPGRLRGWEEISGRISSRGGIYRAAPESIWGGAEKYGFLLQGGRNSLSGEQVGFPHDPMAARITYVDSAIGWKMWECLRRTKSRCSSFPPHTVLPFTGSLPVRRARGRFWNFSCPGTGRTGPVPSTILFKIGIMHKNYRGKSCNILLKTTCILHKDCIY